nr:MULTISPECIES: ABC transporter permease [unclassified Faecalibacterium]
MVSLFGIVALGVMMLTGLMSFAPSMRIAGQKYYVQQNVFDLRVLSTLGLSEEDIAAIAAVDGVEAVQPVKYQDVEAQWQGQSETAVVRLQQLPADPGADTAENMNRLVLLSGRMPEAPDECVVHVMGYGDPVEPGTVLTMPEDTEHVSRKQFTVVGTVQDPQHFSTDKESSTAGDGQLDDIVFLPEGSLTTDYYTACYLKVKNAGLYDNYSDEYQATVDDTAARVKAISGAQCTARRAELIEDASAELADARAEYNDKKAEADRQFAEAEQQLADAQAQLDSAKAQLDAGEAELAANKKALPDTMQGGADELVSGEEQLLEFEDQLQQIEMLVNLKKVADPLLGYAETALHNAQKALDEAEPADEEYTELRDALQKAQDAYDNISGQLNGYQAQLDAGKRQMYAQGLISSSSLSNEQLVTEAKAALRQMKVKLLQGQLQLTTGTATAYTQFDAARTRLDEGWQQYNDGVQQLADSRAEYESRKADAEQQLADGLAQLNDAEEQVSQIKSGEWYVLDRSSTVSFVTFEQYADRMDAIARVFPVFFFLVAALVATTTMTRMVDENRLQLGTLKALGYSNAKIAGKYLFYALSASVLGSIVGMVIGFVVFPLIIWYAYQMIFSMSTFTLHFYPGMAAASVAISAAVIGFATWNACRASLKEKTAALLLPRAPVAGKRIFLEYITPLWQHMSFSQKTTARNLFRYKKRFFMTVLGVAGCTALLLIGFGIQDSILPIVDKQSRQLTHNDLTISLSDEKALTMEQGLADTLDSSSAVRSWGAFYTKSTTLYNEEGGSADVSIVGAEDDARMTEYFTFRTRVGHDPIPFEEDSVILTEKTALNLELSVGDTFYVEAADGSRVPLVLTGITENYMFTRLYLSNAQLQALLGSTPEWNTVYGLTGCTTEAEYNALRTKLLGCNYVSSVSFTEDTTSMFGSLIGSLNYVVVLIIVCAAALAAVVLYNLISVNLAERKKELATIKVLGFYDKEVYRYIFREIELLSLIGSGVGLLLGVPLHRFIVLTVEMDQLMFIRTIAPSSYLLAVALTMLFTFVVCFAMRRHVRHISMVESMKAPE